MIWGEGEKAAENISVLKEELLKMRENLLAFGFRRRFLSPKDYLSTFQGWKSWKNKFFLLALRTEKIWGNKIPCKSRKCLKFLESSEKYINMLFSIRKKLYLSYPSKALVLFVSNSIGGKREKIQCVKEPRSTSSGLRMLSLGLERREESNFPP